MKKEREQKELGPKKLGFSAAEPGELFMLYTDLADALRHLLDADVLINTLQQTLSAGGLSELRALHQQCRGWMLISNTHDEDDPFDEDLLGSRRSESN